MAYMRVIDAKLCDQCGTLFDDKKHCPKCGNEYWMPLSKLIGDVGYNCVCRVDSGVSGTLREARV